MPATALDLAGLQLQAYLGTGTVKLRQLELLRRQAPALRHAQIAL